MQALSSQSLGARCLPTNKDSTKVPAASHRAGSRSSRCTVRAFFPLADIAPQVAATASEVANQANQLTPGSVSAPSWVIPVAAVLVTVGGGAFAFLLKPAKTRLLAGADEAEEVFKRDAKRLTNQARAKAGEIKGKTKQAAKNAQKRTIRGGR